MKKIPAEAVAFYRLLWSMQVTGVKKDNEDYQRFKKTIRHELVDGYAPDALVDEHYENSPPDIIIASNTAEYLRPLVEDYERLYGSRIEKFRPANPQRFLSNVLASVR